MASERYIKTNEDLIEEHLESIAESLKIIAEKLSSEKPANSRKKIIKRIIR